MPPTRLSASIIPQKKRKVKEKMQYAFRLFKTATKKNFLSCKKIKLFFKKGLTKRNKCGIISRYEKNVYVPLAQPDRVFGYEPKGRGFESLKARQTKEDGIQRIPSSFVSRIFTRRTPDKFSQTKIYHNVRSVSKALCCILRTFGFRVPQGSNPPTNTILFCFSYLHAKNPR